MGRPKNRYLSRTPSVGRKAAVAKPFLDVRFDLHDHFPDFNEKRGRCRYCPNGYSNIYCRKCNMVLCLRKDNNCFYLFHHQLYLKVVFEIKTFLAGNYLFKLNK